MGGKRPLLESLNQTPMQALQAGLKRFAKGFIASGLASAAVLLLNGATIQSIDDLKKFSLSLAIAFVTGGILGVEKMVNYENVPTAPQS